MTKYLVVVHHWFGHKSKGFTVQEIEAADASKARDMGDFLAYNAKSHLQDSEAIVLPFTGVCQVGVGRRLTWRERLLGRTLPVLAIMAACTQWLPIPAGAALDPHVPVVVVNDFLCGLHRVQINDFSGLAVDSQPYGDYKSTMLDKENNYVHQFGEKAEVRVTQHNRVAFRLKGETRWAACKPVVFYGETADE